MSCFIASNLNLCEKYCRNRASQRADVSPVEATLATIAAESRPNRSHRSSRPADSPEIPYKYVDLFCEESTLRLVYSIDVIMSMEMAGRSPPFGPRIITLGLWYTATNAASSFRKKKKGEGEGITANRRNHYLQ